MTKFILIFLLTLSGAVLAGGVHLSESNLHSDHFSKEGGTFKLSQPFTAAEKAKLGSLEAKWRGNFLDPSELATKEPNPQDGWGAWVHSTNTIWVQDKSDPTKWEDTGSSSVGDMLAATYDPTNVSKDVFDRANHTGTQPINTIIGLEDALGNNVTTIPEFDPTSVYIKDQPVVKDGELFVANSNINGSTIQPVPFIEGSGSGKWTKVSDYDDEIATLAGQILLRAPKGYTENPPFQNRLAYVATNGTVTYSTLVTSAEAEHLNNVSSNIQDQLDSKSEAIFSVEEVFGFDTMTANNWFQYELGTTNCQFIIRKEGGAIKIGFDSDSSTARNLQGSARLYNRAGATTSTSEWDINAPIFARLWSGSNNGVYEFMEFTPDNYFYVEFNVSLVVRGSEPSDLETDANIQVFEIKVVSDDYSSTATDFAVIIRQTK